MGRGGDSVYRQPGSKVDEYSHHNTRGDIQGSKRVKLIYRQKGTEKRVSNKKNHKGCYEHVPLICISVLIKAVFRL
jgi:hypothetical protein